MGKDNERLERMRARRQERQNHETADWMAADAALVQRAIAAAGYKGGALRFGYTRDGGAYAIGIYLGNDHHTEYVRPNEDIDHYLEGLIQDMGEL